MSELTRDERDQIATFRFGVISEFVTGVRLHYGERERLLREKTSRIYEIPGSSRTRLSRSVIMSWIARYKKAGFRLEGLYPTKRKDLGGFRSLSPEVRMALRHLKHENPRYTVPVLITKLFQMNTLAPDARINRSTVYRFIRVEGLNELKKVETVDRRKYEASFSNEIWQCDVMHGPMVVCEDKQRKSYLLAFLDDHSRLIVHALFYLDETADTLKRALKEAVQTRGLPSTFYVDNGACYRARQLELVTARLGIKLVHAKPYKPQGKGKIERWFQTVQKDFMQVNSTEGLSLPALNERLSSWVDGYNERVHSSTETTPMSRYRKDLGLVRPAPPDLINYFREIEFRRVRKDRTIQLFGRYFEVPAYLIDKKIELRFHRETPEEVEIFFEERSYGPAVKVDVHLNARIGRESTKKQVEELLFDEVLSERVSPPVSSGLFWSAGEDESHV